MLRMLASAVGSAKFGYMVVDSRRWPDKYLIGLTGNIAAGKSSVADLLGRQTLIHSLDADIAAHEVLSPDGECYDAVLAAFGGGILADDVQGSQPTIDRRKLARIVFAAEEKLRQLEQITHPAIRALLFRRILNVAEPIVVLEAIKLLEGSLHREMDAIWVVTASEAERRRRLLEKRGVTKREADERIAAQPPQEEKRTFADVIIHNDGAWQDTKTQVMAAITPILRRYDHSKERLLTPTQER